MKYYVYILQSLKDQKFYTGQTQDLEKRLGEHNSGKVQSTASRRPFKLIYSEEYPNQSQARWREKFLKTAWGKKKLKEILNKIIPL